MASETGCAVHGCTNTRRRLDEWLGTECADHRPATKRRCPCPPLFTFHTTTHTEEDLESLMEALDLKKKKRKPPQRYVVCSHHFVVKEETTTTTNCRLFVDELMRTTEKPFPELCLGQHERPPKRAKLETVWNNEPAPPDMTERFPSESTLPGSSVPAHQDAQVQWEEPTLQYHHSYKSTPTTVAEGVDATVVNSMLLDDSASLLLTGTRLEHFHVIVSVLMPFTEPSFTLPVADQIMMTLMKLKLNLVLGEIAQRFDVSKSMASKVIAHWIDVMGEQFESLVSWLPKETIQMTMPLSFKNTCPQTTCIIDWAESPIQRDKKLDSRNATFSHCKGANNTAKYLVAVAPSGLIMFISGDYDGRVSDKDITKSSGFLEHLRPGDEVMADQGFAIRDLLDQRKVRLIPAFPHKGGHSANKEVKHTRRVVNLHVHVEQAISRLKYFNILSDTLPKSMAKRLAKILTICAALANLREA